MTRRERREAEERARAAALLASGSSGDTVIVGGITFHGPAPISPAVGTPVVARGRHAPAAAYARDLPTAPGAREASAAPGARNEAAAPYGAESRGAGSHGAGSHGAGSHGAGSPVRERPELPQPRRLTVVPRAYVLPGSLQEAVPAAPGTPRSEAAPATPAPATPAPASTAAASGATSGGHRGWSFGVVPPPVPGSPRAQPGLPQAETGSPEVVAEPHRAVGTRAARAGRPVPLAAETQHAPRGRARLPRLALLGVLAAATIAAPLTQFGAGSGDGSSPFDLDLAPTGPSTLDVVSARVAVPQVASGIAAAPVITREPVSASRSEDRDPLPGCDAGGATSSTNGGLGSDELCALPFAPGEQLSSRAAVALTALNDAFRSEFGWDITLADSYRSLGEQYAVKKSRGYLAAKPGTSMHGLGLAIDLGSAVTGNKAAYQWLVENGAAYGWENPPWARRGGSGNYEPWHFEYRPGVEELTTWH